MRSKIDEGENNLKEGSKKTKSVHGDRVDIDWVPDYEHESL